MTQLYQARKNKEVELTVGFLDDAFNSLNGNFQDPFGNFTPACDSLT